MAAKADSPVKKPAAKKPRAKQTPDREQPLVGHWCRPVSGEHAGELSVLLSVDSNDVAAIRPHNSSALYAVPFDELELADRGL